MDTNREIKKITESYMKLITHTVRYYSIMLEKAETEHVPTITMSLLNDLESVMGSASKFVKNDQSKN